MKIFTFWSLLLAFAFIFQSCKDDALKGDDNNEFVDEINETYVPSNEEVKFETIMGEIESNMDYQMGNSLFYSRPDGATADVQIFLDENDGMKKMVYYYTKPNSSSTEKQIFYFNEGQRIISRELFDNGSAFEERITFYNKKDEAIFTKSRTADYEEYLDQVDFHPIDVFACDMKEAIEVLNQEGHFATTFRGFVEETPYLYLIVGEDDMEGYTSSLVVQSIDQSISKLKASELEHVGKTIKIEFERSGGAEGFEYQLLQSAVLGEKVNK